MKADALSKYASSEIENYPGTVYYEVLKTPTIQRKLVAPISLGILLDGSNKGTPQNRVVAYG